MLRFDSFNDAVYAHTDYVQLMHRDGDEMGAGWLDDRFSKYGNGAGVPSYFAWRHAIVDAETADILWMTTEMMDLVQSAMADFDPSEPVTTGDIFIPNGFLVLPHPFLTEDVHGKHISFRAICWSIIHDYGSVVPSIDLVGTPLEERRLAMSGTMSDDEKIRDEVTFTSGVYGDYPTYATVRFMILSYTWDEDDYTTPEDQDGMEQFGWNWGVVHATAIPLQLMSNTRNVSGEGDTTGSWLRFWRVTQKLMQERIVVSDRQQPSRHARRDAARFRMPPPVLRVIELRRPRGDENGKERGTVEWTHRWIVRGHWRNQWYPSENRHRQKYIGAYEKGPADLDLIVKRRVWNWDR